MNDRSHITVKDLNVRCGTTAVLSDVTVTIPDKMITVIIGPSGSGKTTLLKSFNRLLELDRTLTVTGEVRIDGENIYAPGVEVTRLRRKMGLLAQRPTVLPLSIYDNVAFGVRLHERRTREEVDELVSFHLREVSLWEEVKDRLHKPASRLSVGQQQRLCLARGLAVEPEVILGDEPTSALDPRSSRNIEEKFLQLKRSYTIVLVTHILRQARRLADYVIFLYDGRIMEHGPAERMFSRPRQGLTKEYMEGVWS